jgi:hypothetical protein
VRRRVDAAGEPAHDRHAARGEFGGDPLCGRETVRRRPTRADDRDRERVLGGEGATHPQRGRGWHGAQQLGVSGRTRLERH